MLFVAGGAKVAMRRMGCQGCRATRFRLFLRSAPCQLARLIVAAVVHYVLALPAVGPIGACAVALERRQRQLAVAAPARHGLSRYPRRGDDWLCVHWLLFFF